MQTTQDIMQVTQEKMRLLTSQANGALIENYLDKIVDYAAKGKWSVHFSVPREDMESVISELKYRGFDVRVGAECHIDVFWRE